MRGSVYYQSAELTKAIFSAGATKLERIDPTHSNFQKVASYKTMESYRNVWNNFFNYLKEHWQLKDAEEINFQHIIAYMDYKLEYYPSKQYIEKISAALGKLEIALTYYTKAKYGEARNYNFSMRQSMLNSARNFDLVADNYHNRAYADPITLINSLKENPWHHIAARIEYEGGARVEGCALIKKEQLLGYKYDPITKEQKGVIFTKEKGGKVGEILINENTYRRLESCIALYDVFKLKRSEYYQSIKKACQTLNIPSEGTHGLRWNFAKRRMFEYAKAGYSYEQSLQGVSWEMKHNRAYITEHYLGG